MVAHEKSDAPPPLVIISLQIHPLRFKRMGVGGFSGRLRQSATSALGALVSEAQHWQTAFNPHTHPAGNLFSPNIIACCPFSSAAGLLGESSTPQWPRRTPNSPARLTVRYNKEAIYATVREDRSPVYHP